MASPPPTPPRSLQRFIDDSHAVSVSPSCTLNYPNSSEAWWPINRIEPPMEYSNGLGSCPDINAQEQGLWRNYPHVPGDTCPMIAIPIDRVWDQLLATLGEKEMSHYLVNIGANDGFSADPTYLLLEKHPKKFKGIALEPGPTFDALQAKYNRTFPHVLTAKRGIAPSTAVEDARAGNPNDSGKSIDIIKIDIDSCECHILEVLLAEKTGYYRAKIINVEVNHNLPPPIAYREFCVDDAFGRNGGNGQIDVFGCSVQAAYDVLHPHGYELFQYDWPDAVFILSEYAHAFPCMAINSALHHNYWIGYKHARERFYRFSQYSNYPGFVMRTPQLAAHAAQEPVKVLEEIISLYGPQWTKQPLRTDIGIAGTGVSLTVTNAFDRHLPRGLPVPPPEKGLSHLKFEWDQSACNAVEAHMREHSHNQNRTAAYRGKATACGFEYRLDCRGYEHAKQSWTDDFRRRHPKADVRPPHYAGTITACQASTWSVLGELSKLVG